MSETTSKDAPSPDKLVVLDLTKFSSTDQNLGVSLQQDGTGNVFRQINLVPVNAHGQVYAMNKNESENYLLADNANQTALHTFVFFELENFAQCYLPSSALIKAERVKGSIDLTPSAGATMEKSGSETLVILRPAEGALSQPDATRWGNFTKYCKCASIAYTTI